MPANIVYRLTEPTSGHLSGYSKGEALSNTEIDKNFYGVVQDINTKVATSGGSLISGYVEGGAISGSSIDDCVIGASGASSGFFSAVTATNGQFSGLTVVGNETVSGNLTVAGVLAGSGSSLTNLNANNLSTGTTKIARGGTNSTATPTAGAVAYGTGTAYAFTAVGTSGQVLRSVGSGVPEWYTLPPATTIGDDNSASTFYPVFVSATGPMASGYIDSVSGALSYVPSTGLLSATRFVGSLSGCTSVDATALYGTIAADRGVTAGSTAGVLRYIGNTTPVAGTFDGSTTNPSATTRLNYNGNFYATNFYGIGTQLTALNATQLTTGTVDGARGVAAGSATSSFVGYSGTTKVAGMFYGGTTAPASTTRLNYDGNLYATNFYGAFNGNVTGSAGSCTGNAATSTTATNLNGGTITTGAGCLNTGTAGSTGVIEFRGSVSNAASVSFHRAGAYAVNMGLDTDNVFRLGGWSDGASTYRWTADASGNFYARGNLTCGGKLVGTATYADAAGVVSDGTVTGSKLAPYVAATYAGGGRTVAYGSPHLMLDTSSSTYRKVYEWYCPQGGSVYVEFWLVALTGTWNFARVYKNGVAVGTERSVRFTAGKGTLFGETINIGAGDLLQIYVKNVDGRQDPVRLTRISSLSPLTELVRNIDDTAFNYYYDYVVYYNYVDTG